jgi:nicotinamide-nucleotide amidase
MAETLSPLLSEEDEARLSAVLVALRDADFTLATAESCTGGLLSSLFTDVEGCGHVFVAGFVVYTDEAKAAVLGIDAGLIAKETAVSKAVGVAMAEGALDKAETDFAVATTGFTGSAGAEGEPGLVHIACAVKGGKTLHREHHFDTDDRGEGRRAAISASIHLLEAALADHIIGAPPVTAIVAPET